MEDPLHSERLARLQPLGLLASAISRRPLRVAVAAPSERTWTDGAVVYVNAGEDSREQLQSVAVQASLLASGSLEPLIVERLSGRPTLAKRYLGVEGHRALAALDSLLPPAVRSLIRADVAASSESPAASLSVATSRRAIVDPPDSFGTISAQRLLAALRNAARSDAKAPAPNSASRRMLVQLAQDASVAADPNAQDHFANSVGGAGAIGRWLAKLLTPMRQLRGGGSPGADAPTSWSRDGRRGGGSAMLSTAPTASAEDARVDERDAGTRYPEWDVHAGRYREAHCTVHEVDARSNPNAARFAVPDRTSLRRALARLGLGIDRRHRQAQGDDIDLDAAIEAQLERLAGSAPDESVFIDSVRHRRDLSVMLLLDISGSASEPALDGKTVHEHQRATAAALSLALHELGDRVALYAYCSQGRSAVNVTPVKRFSEAPGARVMQRLGNLEPGAYSRLGAAIRHGSALLQDHGGTPRQLLVVISDGLAYDHGYEPAYGAADARRALSEARQQGIGCLCLSVGASTDGETLRRVFGSSAFATLPTPDGLGRVLGPLFRSALRSADVRRRVS